MRIKITKNRSGHSCLKLSDVRLSVNSSGGEARAVVVTFYNENHKKVTTTDFISPSIDKEMNRLYFETGDHINGFKVSVTGCNKKSPKIRFHIDDESEWKSREGFFNLLYDTTEKLYYIDLDHKI